MRKTLAFVAGGLLVLALGCGDDKKTPATGDEDAGAGTGGSSSSSGGKGGSGGGSGGSSGSGTSGKGGSGGGGGAAGMVSADQCTTMTTAIMVPATCATCVCKADLKDTLACNKDVNCWLLLQCIGDKCNSDASNACLMDTCKAYSAGMTAALTLGAMITSMCKTECGTMPAASPDGGGTDAGN